MFFKSWRPPEGVMIVGKIEFPLVGKGILKRAGPQPNNAEELGKRSKLTESMQHTQEKPLHANSGRHARMKSSESLAHTEQPQAQQGRIKARVPPPMKGTVLVQHQIGDALSMSSGSGHESKPRGAPKHKALAISGSVKSGSGLESTPKQAPKHSASGSHPANGADVIQVRAPTSPRHWGHHGMPKQAPNPNEASGPCPANGGQHSGSDSTGVIEVHAPTMPRDRASTPKQAPKHRASGSCPANGGHCQQQLSESEGHTLPDPDSDSKDVNDIEVHDPHKRWDWGGHHFGKSSTRQQSRRIGSRGVGQDNPDLDVLREMVQSKISRFSDHVGATRENKNMSKAGWLFKAHPHLV